MPFHQSTARITQRPWKTALKLEKSPRFGVFMCLGCSVCAQPLSTHKSHSSGPCTVPWVPLVKHHPHLSRGISVTHTAPDNTCSPPDEAPGLFSLLQTQFPILRAKLELQSPQKAAGPLCCVQPWCEGVKLGWAVEPRSSSSVILWGFIPGDSTWGYPWHSLSKGCHQSGNPQMKDRGAPKAQEDLELVIYEVFHSNMPFWVISGGNFWG